MTSTDFSDMHQKLSTLLTMASEVQPGNESQGVFWCHGPGLDPEAPNEPPFATMIDVPTLFRAIASHPDLVDSFIQYRKWFPRWPITE